jgi:threonine aldolase
MTMYCCERGRLVLYQDTAHTIFYFCDACGIILEVQRKTVKTNRW